jgi:hypothetical protein
MHDTRPSLLIAMTSSTGILRFIGNLFIVTTILILLIVL